MASAPTGVLITGETGTGKELIAQAIHDLSPRHGRPFVAVNCGPIPVGLVESELFGYERGAFTGATQNRPGKVRQSNGGTLFLDEVSELELPAQVKLLRLLESREVQPLGSARTEQLNLRVVAASNQNLAQRVRERTFREDLFYRINVVRLEVRPLRARSEDVPLLVAGFGRVGQRQRARPRFRHDGDAEGDVVQHFFMSPRKKRPAITVNQAADGTGKHKATESPCTHLAGKVVDLGLAPNQIHGEGAIERIILRNDASREICAKGIDSTRQEDAHRIARIEIPKSPGAREQPGFGVGEGNARNGDG